MRAHLFLPLVTFLLMPLLLNAGPITSGGGNAVLCKNPQGEFVSAELFDLFEGAAIYNYSPVKSNDAYQAQARAFAKKLSDSMNEDFFTLEMERLISEMKLLPANASLNPVKDNDSVVKPANCEVYQAAVYQPNQKVYFDSKIWNWMDETNKAALLSHEVLYAYLRRSNGVTNSIRARQYVSYLFAGNQLVAIRKNLYTNGQKHELCSTHFSDKNPEGTPWTAFRTFLNPDGSWTISFIYLHGNTVLASTELNGEMEARFSWPASDHQTYQNTGAGIRLKNTPLWTAPLDEGFSVDTLAFADGSDAGLLILNINGESKWLNFRCRVSTNIGN